MDHQNKRSRIIVSIVVLIIAMIFIIAPGCKGCSMPDACNSCTVCGNKQYFDFNYEFNYAIIKLPNGDIVEGKVQTWNDYSDGSDQLQIKINGVVYLVHSTNCVLEYR